MLSSLLRAARTRLLIAVFILLAMPSAQAHELRPAIADMSMEADTVSVAIELNLEAAIAGIGADHDDTDDAPEAAAYDALRESDPAALRAAFDGFAPDFLSRLTLRGGGPVSISEVTIPAVGDTDLSRETVVTVTAPLIAEAVEFGWDESLGDTRIFCPKASTISFS